MFDSLSDKSQRFRLLPVHFNFRGRTKREQPWTRAAPSWRDDNVQLAFWFIKESCPATWDDMIEEWLALFDQSGRFTIEFAVACGLEDMTAKDYIESNRLELDQLSIPRPDTAPD
jgi:hypothetical protein